MKIKNISRKTKAVLGAASGLAAVCVTGYLMAAASFVPGDQPTGFIGPVEVTNVNVTSGNEIAFTTYYEKENWTGNVFAYPISAAGQVDKAGELWSGGAQTHLDSQNYDTGRNIVTMKDDGTKIPFRWDSLSSAQQTAIGNSTTGQQILNFVRGDRSNESASGLRMRTSALGDIMHSRAYYMKNGGSPVLFVGANDGMLHVFDAASNGGDELWAYVPSMLIPNLNKLAANPYVHTYFVDGGLSVGNVKIGGVDKTVLVSGLGAGGKGLFALDVTNPRPATEAAAASNILWEITPSKINGTASTSYANLGYTYGTPQIAKLNTGDYAAIVGNGYNNSGDGKAHLYVIKIDDGSLIKDITAGTTGVGGPNGLSTPFLVDTDGNGTVDKIYAGDLDGTMWKFDLSANSAASWSSSATALYVTSPAQPITSAPAASLHPKGGYMVTFGTGRTLSTSNPNDLTDTSTFYAYGIWDGAPATNTTLISQTLAEKNYTFNGTTTRIRVVSSTNTPNWSAGGNKGWKVALPAGERIVGDGVFQENERFYFQSYNPTVTNTSPTPNGENWLMELDYLSGGAKNSPFLDLNGDLILNDSDRAKYVAGDTFPSGKAAGDPIDGSTGVPVGKMITTGVASQPILVELQTLNTTLLNENPDVTIPQNNNVERGVAGGHFDVDLTYRESTLCNGTYTGGAYATGSLTFTYSNSLNLSKLTIKIGTNTVVNSNPPSSSKSQLGDWVASNETTNLYTVTSDGHGKVTFTAKNKGTTYNGAVTVVWAASSGTLTYTTVDVAGGVDPDFTDTSCPVRYHHTHQYDDKFDVTGVNMLNASDTQYNLSNPIPSTSTNFKLLVQNQYLNPAVKIKIGGQPYQSVKNITTSSTLDVASLPTYNRSNIIDFIFNMPVNAFTPRDWWGNGDVRVGLQPTVYSCVWDSLGNSAGKNVVSGQDPTLFQPIVPPSNGTDGPGTIGTTTGARRNGALVLQLIAANTPNTAIEQNVAGRPEYGWRVKSTYFETYVLAEYVTYWHHKKCYGSTGWSKTPGDDPTSSSPVTPAPGAADPKDGDFGSGVATTGVTTVTNGNVTTITTTYSDGSQMVVTKTKNADGTITIRTVNPDGTITTVTVADTSGDVKTGGDEKGTLSRTGRISWSEMYRN